MSEDPRGTEGRFELSGGRLALDFVNTQGGMRGVSPKEHLNGYADVVAFARQARVLDETRARRLLAEARRRPADASAALRGMVELREALYRIFLARARGAGPAAGDVERLSAALGRALAHRRLERRDDAFELGWDASDPDLEAPIWPVVQSAADLLTSDEALGRVRVCGLYHSDECSWLFVDETRSGTRRWCSMDDCGNKAKARRHYERKRKGGGG